MYPRYQVLPFSEASLIAFIEHFTETPYSIVQSKRQIKYLNGYLKRWSIVSMLIETTYIDSSFVEDFSQYYVKCFQHHKRNCSRIHFFNETAEEVVELISENEQLSEDKEALQKALDENKATEELKTLSEALQQTMFSISQKAYEATQQTGEAQSSDSAQSENASSSENKSDDDDVIDAEYTKS